MMPEAMPKVSLSTLTTGARQLVVQLAFEMMLCFAASYLSSFTPRTMVKSSLVAGAEMMTFLTVLPRWALAFSASVNKPVDSTTICAPTEAQSSLAGSRSAKTLIFFPSTAMKSEPWVISFFRLPRMESYLRRWASVAGVVRSFTATNSMSGFPKAERNTLRPMRPKPLMPTFTAAMIFGCSCRVCCVEYQCNHFRAKRKGPHAIRVGSYYWAGTRQTLTQLLPPCRREGSTRQIARWLGLEVEELFAEGVFVVLLRIFGLLASIFFTEGGRLP